MRHYPDRHSADLDQVSAGKCGAGIGVVPMPASPIIYGEHEVGGEVRKTPTAATALTLKCKKDPQTTDSYA